MCGFAVVSDKLRQLYRVCGTIASYAKPRIPLSESVSAKIRQAKIADLVDKLREIISDRQS